MITFRTLVKLYLRGGIPAFLRGQASDRAHQVVGGHGEVEFLGDHLRCGAGELFQAQGPLQAAQIRFDIPASPIQGDEVVWLLLQGGE